MPQKIRGSATVELALLAPILGLFVVGLAAIAVVVQAELGLVAVVEEASRAAAHSPTADQAIVDGVDRGQQVGAGYALRNGTLQITIDPSAFGPGGSVGAAATYRILGSDVPLLGLVGLDLERRHAEPVARFRSFAP